MWLWEFQQQRINIINIIAIVDDSNIIMYWCAYLWQYQYQRFIDIDATVVYRHITKHCHPHMVEYEFVDTNGKVLSLLTTILLLYTAVCK